MRKVVTTLLFLIMCASLAFSMQTPTAWIKYDSAEGRYTVSLPAQPTLKTQEAMTNSGEKFTQYMATAVDGNTVYMIGYFDYQPPTTFSLEKARDGMLASVKGTLLKENLISLGGYSGLEFDVSAAAANGTEYLVRVRAYDVDKRVYILQFLYLKTLTEDVVRPRATKYFDSFHVKKPVSGS